MSAVAFAAPAVAALQLLGAASPAVGPPSLYLRRSCGAFGKSTARRRRPAYCTEEELVTSTGTGPGGALALGPFVVGVTAPGWLPAVGLGGGIDGVVGGDALAAGVALAGLAWIVGAQLRLYTAVNGVLRGVGAPPSMTWWWALAPGFNIVGGIRLIHFTAVAAVLAATAADDGEGVGGAEAAAEREAGLAALNEDVLVRRFPWIGVPKLGALQLLTTPSLWVKF
ncbi:hypothetical protein MMPV_002937 [Pyropia vietnamensis]